MKLLNSDVFKKWEEHTYTLIHVLPKEHYQNLHIKGSINICFSNSKSMQTPYQTDINYILDGELTLRGITKQQSINALISKIDEKLVLNARVEIDRTHWNIIYGSAKFFKFLGMHKIFDKIFIEMRLELT